MSEFKGNKYFTIHRNDAGTEAYRDTYVEWLELQVKLRDDIIGLSEGGDRHGHLVAEIEDLKAQLANAEDAAHRLTDDLARADRELIEQAREMR